MGYKEIDKKKQALDNKILCKNLKISQDEPQQLLTITLHCKTKFEDPKEVIKICKSYKNNQCNEQKK
jgi:hypothetical protein